MFTDLSQVDFDAVLRDWAASEAHKDATPEYQAGPCLSAMGPVSWIVFWRGRLVGPMLERPTTWFSAKARCSDLGIAKSIAYFGADATVADVKRNRPEYSLDNFDVDCMIGSPILVTDNITSVPFLLDGYHRSCSILDRTNETAVFVGVCPSLFTCHWFAGR